MDLREEQARFHPRPSCPLSPTYPSLKGPSSTTSNPVI